MAAVAALRDVLHVLITFRGRHLSLARKADSKEARLWPVGSAGGNLDLLRKILDRTREGAALMGS